MRGKTSQMALSVYLSLPLSFSVCVCVWEMYMHCVCVCAHRYSFTYVKVTGRHQVSSSLVYFLRQRLCLSGFSTVAISLQKGQGSGSCLAHETECLSSPSLVLESQGSPRQLLVFSLHWNSEEVGFNTSKGMSGEQNRWTCSPEWEKADKKPKTFFFCILLGVAQI